MNYLENHVLAKLSKMPASARNMAEGRDIGTHRAKARGHNLEYREHRQYNPGDHLKQIDWKVYARTQRFYVKEYEEDKNFNILILMDESASMMDSPFEKIPKIDYARHLGMTLAYLYMQHGDRVGIAGFGDRFQQYLHPTININSLFVLDNNLTAGKGQKKTDFTNLDQGINIFNNKSAMLFIISDFIASWDEIESCLSKYKGNKFEIILFHLIGKAERDFPFKGEVEFIEPESGQKVLVNTKSIQNLFTKEFHKHIRKIRNFSQLSSIEYIEVFTETHYLDNLVNFLRKYEVKIL